MIETLVPAAAGWRVVCLVHVSPEQALERLPDVELYFVRHVACFAMNSEGEINPVCPVDWPEYLDVEDEPLAFLGPGEELGQHRASLRELAIERNRKLWEFQARKRVVQP